MDKKLSKMKLKRDKKYRVIYTNRSETHYVIKDADLRKFEFYHNRYIAAFTLMLLVSIMNPYIAVAVGVVALIVLEYLFRNVFLDKCMVIDRFIPNPEDKDVKRPKSSYLILSLLYFVLGAVLIAYTIMESTGQQMIFISIGIALFAIFSGILSLVTFFNYDNN